ncbi:PAS domain S-box protein [Thiolapillus sp.]
MSRWPFFILLLLGMIAPTGNNPATAAQNPRSTPAAELTLGVFSYFSPAEASTRYQPLADYLNSRQADMRIKLKVMNLHEIDDALASRDLDFIITNPGHYILLRERYNLKGALATIVRRTGEGQSTQQTGGVIFTRRNRADISRLEDLEGKWIAVAGTKHLSGYEAQAYELLQAGILLPQDAHLIETGNYDAVIDAVVSENVDAGFVPAGVLEDAWMSGEHSLDIVKTINTSKPPGFPYMVSTRLYPQWPVFALPHVEQEFVDAFLAGLATLKPSHPAAQAAKIAGFAPPADYHSVENIIQALELPPYDVAPTITLPDIWEQHKLTGSILLLATLVILVLLHLLITRNRQLHTQRLLAEDSANHFEQIIHAAQAGTWKWNIKTGNAIFNDRWAEIIGYTLAELSPVSIDTWVQLTHPDDFEAAQKLVQQHFRGETEYFECSFRMRHKDGHWVWIQSRGKVTNWEADGTPLWMFGTHMDITERKEASLALQESQAKYQQLIDNVGEKFIIYSHRGLTGELTYVSDGVSSIFGLPKEEVLGKSWFEVVKWLPQDAEKAKAYIKQRMEGKATFMQFEMRFVHPSGSKHTLRVSSHPVWDANGKVISIDGIAEDVTEQKRSQERARMAATVFAHSQESIIITDTDALIIDCNPASGRLTGYSREELIGRNPRLFSSGTHTAGFYKHLWQTLTSGRVWQGAFRNVRKNGTPYWIEASISPIKDHDGKITQYIAVSRDITRRKQQLGALRQAKREAQAANTAKSEFVANISHEIRTPMNAILGFTDLCLEGDLAPQQRKYLGNVKESAHTMLSLINEILDFSKIEAGKLVLESIPFDLSKELTMITSLTRQLIHTKEVELELIHAANGPITVLGDPLRLKQILTNLTSNAVKFTNRGKIQIIAKELERDDDSVEIEFSVCDSGIGMNKNKLTSIFQPFSQADSSTTRKFGGTGLGLTISSQLIEKMGGEIKVDSEPGIGSTFYFRLRFPLAKEGIPTDESQGALQRSFKQLQNTRVLLVEDNEINRDLATEVLERHQLLVDTASDGQKALEKLEQKQYDLVLMDIQMPIMDGYEATWAIRNQLKLGKLPIIALTASTSSIVREKCMRAGMDDYISKPIDIHELMEKIDKIINPVLQKMATNQPLAPFSSPQTTPGSFQPPPGINAALAMQRLALDEEDYIRLLKKFAANHSEDTRLLADLAREENWEDARRLAHTLKGLSSTIGATELAHMAAQLEQLCKTLSASPEAETRKAAFSDLNALLKVADKSLKEITGHIDELQEAIAPVAPSQPEQSPDLPEKLQSLLKLTEQYNVAALTEANALLGMAADQATVSELQNIRDDLENFDFDAAAAGLKTLLVHL